VRRSECVHGRALVEEEAEEGDDEGDEWNLVSDAHLKENRIDFVEFLSFCVEVCSSGRSIWH
jgi:hypothetical protein